VKIKVDSKQKESFELMFKKEYIVGHIYSI